MPITINGSGTVTGISAGGLPDDSIIAADIAAGVVTPAKLSTGGPSWDSSGRFLIANQPAFAAYRTATQAISGNTDTKVSLNTVEFNVGGHFNTSTYRFTAPVSGRYLFTATIQFEQTGNPHSAFFVNGSLSVDGWINFVGSAASTQARVLSLSANDYVELYAYHNISNNISTRTKMTGYLIG